MLTLGTIILIAIGAAVVIAILGVALDIFAALSLALAVPFALVGKEIILIIVGIGIYLYIKNKKIL